MSKALIAYYSRADENYVSGQIISLKKGNTEIAAEYIKQIKGGDLFEIEQAQPYSKNYNECIEQARIDQRNNERPKLKSTLNNLDDYDTIYLGYPNYWSTMPMAVFTFLEGADFSGKVIKPFCTHEGSGLGKSVTDIERSCPNASVEKGIALHGAEVQKSKSKLEKWING